MEMTIDLVSLAGNVTIVLVLVGGFWKLYRPIKDQLDRIDKLERWVARQQKDITTSKEHQMALSVGILACLEGLKEHGIHGPVSDAANDMIRHLVKQANKGVSYGPEESR